MRQRECPGPVAGRSHTTLARRPSGTEPNAVVDSRWSNQPAPLTAQYCCNCLQCTLRTVRGVSVGAPGAPAIELMLLRDALKTGFRHRGACCLILRRLLVAIWHHSMIKLLPLVPLNEVGHGDPPVISTNFDVTSASGERPLRGWFWAEIEFFRLGPGARHRDRRSFSQGR